MTSKPLPVRVAGEYFGELDLPVEAAHGAVRVGPGGDLTPQPVDLGAEPLFLLAVCLEEGGLEVVHARDLIVAHHVQF